MKTCTLSDKLLLSAEELAGVLGFSIRQIRRWDYDGVLPTPMVFKRSKRWRKADIEAWVAAGCPGGQLASQNNKGGSDCVRKES